MDFLSSFITCHSKISHAEDSCSPESLLIWHRILLNRFGHQSLFDVSWPWRSKYIYTVYSERHVTDQSSILWYSYFWIHPNLKCCFPILQKTFFLVYFLSLLSFLVPGFPVKTAWENRMGYRKHHIFRSTILMSRQCLFHKNQ